MRAHPSSRFRTNDHQLVPQSALYARAYYHFHRVHRSRTNLWLHLLCLPLQIGSNFALAAEIDRIAGVDHYSLSLITAVVWAVHLLLTPSPYLIRLLTVGSICAAYASRHAVVAAWLPLMWAAGALHVLVLKYHRFYPLSTRGRTACPARCWRSRALARRSRGAELTHTAALLLPGPPDKLTPELTSPDFQARLANAKPREGLSKPVGGPWP